MKSTGFYAASLRYRVFFAGVLFEFLLKDVQRFPVGAVADGVHAQL